MIGDGSIDIGFGKVPGYRAPGWPERSSAPKRYHLECGLISTPPRAENALVLGAAASRSEQPNPSQWRVLLDPGGHPFDICLKG